jgi:hypothetical protein
MKSLRDVTTSQLRRILAIKEQLEALQSRMDSIVAGGGGGDIRTPSAFTDRLHPVPAAVQAKMAAAAKAGRAEIEGSRVTAKGVKEKGRRGSRAGISGGETEIRETGRGLVEHLDEIGRRQGHAQLVQSLMSLRIRYADEGGGRGGVRGFRAKIRVPFHPDTMPDWLKLGREQFPALGEAIYSFADRHRDRVLRRHERSANIAGLSNFMDVMVAASRVLYVYLRRGILTQPQVVARMRDYLNLFTGKFPLVPGEETTGFLARIYSNGRGNPGPLLKQFEEHNVAGHLRALLLVAQVVRASQDGSDASQAGSQLPLLVDQIKLFENRIGLGGATEEQIGRALEDYGMLTKKELAVWTRALQGSGKVETALKSVNPAGQDQVRTVDPGEKGEGEVGGEDEAVKSGAVRAWLTA